ncbi:unnamed protein product [Ectocarpus sp. CCAP 1310/34]|nr:unnamed protein product [Ectocarpus sp. CCAP 1310/34]
MDGGPLAPTTGATARVSGVPTPQGGPKYRPQDTEHGARGGEEEGKAEESSMATAPEPSAAAAKQVAPMRNLYTAAMSYNGYTVTDGALRLIVLLHAADLGFNAIEIAFMFSAYEVAGVFTNLFGGVAGSKYGLRFTLLTSLVLQIVCLSALTQTEPVLGDLKEATPGNTRYLEATIYITAWQALAGVAKDLMKLTGKATPKLVTKEGAEGRLFRVVAWLTGMKNALKGFGSFLGALLVAQIGYVKSLWILVGICAFFVPVGIFGMDRGLGVSDERKTDWNRLFRKGRNVNVLSAARFFLFGSRDVWFEIGLPLFLRAELGWKRELVGLIMAGLFAVNSSVHSYLIVSYSNKDKVAMDLGFYYMANAMGRLIGVLVGGFLYHYTSDDFGLSMCLVVACPFLVAAAAISYHLPGPATPPSPTTPDIEFKAAGA